VFNGVTVFSATTRDQRARLGETMTAWRTENVDLAVVVVTVRQSSDSEFHCITIVVAY
jgi:hypothetical protein